MTYIQHLRSRHIVFYAIIAAVTFSCRGSDPVSDSARDYYIDALGWSNAGMVYIYEPVNDPAMPDEIWHYRFIPDYRGNYVWSARYGADGEIVQRSREHIGADHAVLTSMDLRFILPDTTYEVFPSINKGETFGFGSVEEPLRAEMQIEYQDPTSDSVRVVLTRQRVLEKVGRYPFEGEEQPALFVRTEEMLETETEGFTTTVWSGTEIYVQHVGMVYYKKEISELMTLEYRLRERISFEQYNLESKTATTGSER